MFWCVSYVSQSLVSSAWKISLRTHCICTCLWILANGPIARHGQGHVALGHAELKLNFQAFTTTCRASQAPHLSWSYTQSMRYHSYASNMYVHIYIRICLSVLRFIIYPSIYIYISLGYITLDYIAFQYNSLRCITWHNTTLHCRTLHYIKLHYVTLIPPITSNYTNLITYINYIDNIDNIDYITLHYIHFIHVHLYITLDYITSLHYITLHYITLH